MAKKTAANKKSGSKKQAVVDGDLVILLPPDAYNDYKAIKGLNDPNNPNDPVQGDEILKSILRSVFGTDTKFHISGVKIGNKSAYQGNPEPDLAPLPRKC